MKNKIRCLIIFFVLLMLPVLSFSADEKMSKEDYLKEIDKMELKLEAEPSNPRLHNTLGFYYFKVGKYDKAKKEYNLALKYDKEFSVPYNNLGILALKDKDYSNAETYFSNAIEKNPKYAKAVYNLGVTYFKQKKYVKALKCYFKAKDVDEEYVKEREDMEKGDAELTKALKEDPDNKFLKYLIEKKANEKKEE